MRILVVLTSTPTGRRCRALDEPHDVCLCWATWWITPWSRPPASTGFASTPINAVRGNHDHAVAQNVVTSAVRVSSTLPA